MNKTNNLKVKQKLAKYAVSDKNTAGRRYKETFPDADFRVGFQHDRDRVLHSKAFRRLNAKTQVVLSNESDHNRTRLTHSLEVGQMSESIAISLGLNTFATWAISLGHDLRTCPIWPYWGKSSCKNSYGSQTG